MALVLGDTTKLRDNCKFSLKFANRKPKIQTKTQTDVVKILDLLDIMQLMYNSFFDKKFYG